MRHGCLCRGPWVATPPAVGLHHSPSFAPCVLYHEVLYSVLALIHESLTRPCRRCDVPVITKPFTPSPYVTHRHDIVNPPPRSVCDVIYGRPLELRASPLISERFPAAM